MTESLKSELKGLWNDIKRDLKHIGLAIGIFMLIVLMVFIVKTLIKFVGGLIA